VIRKAPVKRPAGEPKEKAKGGREPRIKQARHAGGTPAPHRKKAKPSAWLGCLVAALRAHVGLQHVPQA